MRVQINDEGAEGKADCEPDNLTFSVPHRVRLIKKIESQFQAERQRVLRSNLLERVAIECMQ